MNKNDFDIFDIKISLEIKNGSYHPINVISNYASSLSLSRYCCQVVCHFCLLDFEASFVTHDALYPSKIVKNMKI